MRKRTAGTREKKSDKGEKERERERCARRREGKEQVTKKTNAKEGREAKKRHEARRTDVALHWAHR